MDRGDVVDRRGKVEVKWSLKEPRPCVRNEFV
jgi:hypothetical protein